MYSLQVDGRVVPVDNNGVPLLKPFLEMLYKGNVNHLLRHFSYSKTVDVLEEVVFKYCKLVDSIPALVFKRLLPPSGRGTRKRSRNAKSSYVAVSSSSSSEEEEEEEEEVIYIPPSKDKEEEDEIESVSSLSSLSSLSEGGVEGGMIEVPQAQPQVGGKEWTFEEHITMITTNSSAITSLCNALQWTKDSALHVTIHTTLMEYVNALQKIGPVTQRKEQSIFPEDPDERRFGVSERARELNYRNVDKLPVARIGKRAFQYYCMQYTGFKPPKKYVREGDRSYWMNMYTPTTTVHTLDKALRELAP